MAVTKSTDPIDILLEMGIDLDNLSEEEDYLSALKEAIAKIQFQTKGSGDERSAILSQEVIKVRKSRKAADPKFKAKKTTVSPDAFFDKKKPQENQEALPKTNSSAIVKRSSLAPELFKKPEEPEEQKDNKDLKENNILKDILNTLNSILGTLKNQNKLATKQAEKDRKAKEKKKRGAQEDKLESPIKKFLGAAEKVVKPVKNFLDGLLEFFVKVFIGRLLFKLIDWGKENPEKVDAILGFFEKTWPALLAVGLLFFTGLGGFIGSLIGLIGGFIPILLGLGGKIIKGALGLIKFAATNPFAAGALLFGAGALIPKLFPDTVDAEEKKTEAAPGTNEEKIKALEEQKANLNPLERLQGVGAEIDEQIEFLKTGKTAQYGKKFNKGGIVPGSGNTDSVRAMLTPGEFVMSKGAVQQYGLDTMKSMNAAGGGTNIPMVSGGITYAAGGGEIADPDEKLKPNDEPKDRPEGDHSHKLSHIFGLDKMMSSLNPFSRKPKAKESTGGTERIDEMSLEQLRSHPALDVTQTGASNPAVFKAAQAARREGKDQGLTGEALEKKVLIASIRAKDNTVTLTPKTPAVSSTTTTEQPKKNGGNMFGGFMDAMTFNMFDFDGLGRPEDKKGPVNDKDNSSDDEDNSGNDKKSEEQLSAEKANAELLSFISKGEGGYNSMNQGTSGGRIVGSTHNAASILGKNLTDMTVGEVMGHQSSGRLFAAGRYQIIPSTMKMAVARAKLSPDDPFNQSNQDKLGLALIYNGQRPKLAAYLRKESNDLRGAMLDLALEWASAPHPDTGRSAYPPANKSSHTVEEVKAALMSARESGAGKYMSAASSSTSSLRSSRESSASGITPSPGSGDSSGGSLYETSGTSGSTGKFQSTSAPGGPGSVGSKTSYGDYLKTLYGKKKSADGITPLPSSTMSKGKSAGGPNADAGKNPGNQLPSPDNSLPSINAEAMHSDEKIEVLGIEIS